MDGQQTSDTTPIDIDEVFEILPGQATLEQARDFLKRKGLEHSAGSWCEMLGNRLSPMLADGRVSEDDLVDFLCEAEEYGKQHVLFFRATPSVTKALMHQPTLEKTISSDSRFPKLGERYIVSMPAKPMIAEIRRDSDENSESVTIKMVERRFIKLENKVEEYEEDGYFVRRVPTEPYRAANIVKVHSDGLCEVRIHSHSDAFDYSYEALGVLKSLAPLIDDNGMVPISLQGVRSYIWDPKHRDQAKKIFSLRASEHLNGSDGRLRPSTAALGESMLDDNGLVGAIDQFHSTEASVLRATVSMRKNEHLLRSLNVNFSGADNEFFVTAKITKQEYTYVVRQILSACEKMK